MFTKIDTYNTKLLITCKQYFAAKDDVLVNIAKRGCIYINVYTILLFCTPLIWIKKKMFEISVTGQRNCSIMLFLNRIYRQEGAIWVWMQNIVRRKKIKILIETVQGWKWTETFQPHTRLVNLNLSKSVVFSVTARGQQKIISSTPYQHYSSVIL